MGRKKVAVAEKRDDVNGVTGSMQNVDNSEEEYSDEKKKRGRPKKAIKTEVKEETSDDITSANLKRHSYDNSSVTAHDGKSEIKRKRGRQKKMQTGSDTIPANSEETATSEGSSVTVKEEEGGSEDVSLLNRKNKPSKRALKEADTETRVEKVTGAEKGDGITEVTGGIQNVNSDEEYAGQKKKRGRPKKAIKTEVKEEASDDTTSRNLKRYSCDNSSVTGHSDEREIKRKRGRPKKMQNGSDTVPASSEEAAANEGSSVTVKEEDGNEGTSANEGSSVTVKEEDGNEGTSSLNRKKKPSKGAVKEDDTETKVKKAVERSVVKKGRAAVDGLCPVAKTSHVYEEDDDVWDCMLNQTNIQFNNNKYYLIQLLKDDRENKYFVWMRWGRVGMNGQNSLQPSGSDLDKAKNIFMKKFSDKTRNEWFMRDCFEKVPGKYDLLRMDYTEDEVDNKTIKEKTKEPPKKIECTLQVSVRELIELICDVKAMEEAVVEMKYDTQKAPLGKLTADQVKAGYLALKKIDDLITNGSTSNQALMQACNDFYTRIPHYFGMKAPPLIRTKAEVREKISLLEALGDIQAALTVLGQIQDDDMHPVDQQYRSLGCDISTLDKASDTFKMLEKYLQSTHARTHSHYKMKVLKIYSCTKTKEKEQYDDVGNRMLLWHGSRLTNWAGILSQGLRIAPPEAPSTGYMFGKGIYFADASSKSANYCMATTRSNVGLLVMCDVALGTCNELIDADYKADRLPKGCHSVKGLGRTAPNPKNFEKLSDGVIVPMGPLEETKVNSSCGYTLQYNEYVVYNPAQVQLRYLVKVSFSFK